MAHLSLWRMDAVQRCFLTERRVFEILRKKTKRVKTKPKKVSVFLCDWPDDHAEGQSFYKCGRVRLSSTLPTSCFCGANLAFITLLSHILCDGIADVLSLFCASLESLDGPRDFGFDFVDAPCDNALGFDFAYSRTRGQNYAKPTSFTALRSKERQDDEGEEFKLISSLLCQQQEDGASVLPYESVLRAVRGRSSSPSTPDAEHAFRSVSHLFTANPNNPELQLSVIKFLNSLIASTSNAAHRNAVREDLAYHGLIAALESFSKAQESEPENQSTSLTSTLQAQIHMFLTSRESDLRAKDEESAVATASEVPGDSEKTTWNVSITDAFSTDTSAVEVSGQQEDASNGESSQSVHLAELANSEIQTTKVTVIEGPSENSCNQLEETPCSGLLTTEKTGESNSTSVTMESKSEVASQKQLNDQPHESTLLQSLVNQLESQQLDATTSEEIARVLQTLVLSLSTEKTKGLEVMDRLEKSLSSASNMDQRKEEAHASSASTVESTLDDSEPMDALKRVRSRLLSGFSDAIGSSISSPRKVSVAKPSSPQPSFLHSLENFFSGSAAPTPAKPAVHHEESTSLVPATSEKSGAVGSSANENHLESEKPAAPKLTLPFFQSFRRGPGLGAMPACTPVATASVRKDAKRHSFSSFVPPALPVQSMPSGESAAMTPTGPTLPSLSLMPLMPAAVMPSTTPSLTVCIPSRLEEAAQHDESSDAAPATGTDVSKFRKLPSMGAPKEAVRAKMRQAGLDPDLLDEKLGFDVPPSSIPPAAQPPQLAAEPVIESAANPPLETTSGPDISKFRKLLSMGAPLPAVKAKMIQAGLDPALLDQKAGFTEQPAALPPPLVVAVTSASPVTEISKVEEAAALQVQDIAKFKKLLSMSPLAAAVKSNMQQAGLNPDLLDTTDAEMPTSGGEAPATPTSQKTQVLVKDDPDYAKFFKLLAMGAPAETVKMKMQMAGLKPELLDTPDAQLTPAGGGGNQPDTNSANTAKPNAARRAHLAISIKPAVKQTTRSFYWQHIRGDAIKGTIWEEIEKESSGQNNETPLVLSDSELSVLESEFPPPQAANGPATGSRQRTNSIDHTAMGLPLASPRVVSLIDRARANNISIIIKQFRMSHAALREAIMKLDPNVLTLERVQGLIKIMPTEEEITAVTGFQGDPLTLNEAERILKELISVPRLKQRLDAFQAKLQFPNLVRDLQTKVTKLRSASTELAQSSEFKTILLVVLQVGNKMNQGTNRGDAKGFRLGDLAKLVQLKSVDKSVTLLHFVVRMIRLKKGNLVRLGDALTSLYDVQNIPIPELHGDMAKITEVTDYIGNELAAQKLKNAIEEKEECDWFVSVMDEFMECASSTTTALKAELDATMQLLKDTMTRFDKDTDDDNSFAPKSKGPPNAASMAGACEFFSTVYEFSVALMKADRENELKRLKEERQQKLQQQKSQLPTRSQSSVDLLSGLSGRSKSMRSEIKKVDEKTAGPETPETSVVKHHGSRIPGGRAAGMSPVMRSASMSSILEFKSTEPGSPAPSVNSAATKDKIKSPEQVATERTEKPKSTTKQVPSESAAAKPPPCPSQIPIQTTQSKKEDQVSQPLKVKAQKDSKVKEKPTTMKEKSKTMMAVPGKIIKATKQAATLSPLKIAPPTSSGSTGGSSEDNMFLSSLKKMANSSVEKGKRHTSSGDRIVPVNETLRTPSWSPVQLGAVIYYRVESTQVAGTLISASATTASLFADGQAFGVLQSGVMIVLPPYSCKIFAVAVKEGMTTSPLLVSSEYAIYASKYAFLVPYFNGAFHGKVVRLKLDVKGKKRPRPARFLEFSDYESPMGIGPYSDQVSVVDLTALNANFKGFYGGLTAFAETAFVNETYQVPAADDANYMVTKWRLVFENQYTPHASHLGLGTPARVLQDAEYLYLAPFYNGAYYSGTVIRILTLTFSDTPFIEQLNLTAIHPELKGFGSSFTDYSYAYFVPRENEHGLLGKWCASQSTISHPRVSQSWT
ncbi:Formin-homology 2 domain-containing protein, partial [Globisporangium splendens]